MRDAPNRRMGKHFSSALALLFLGSSACTAAYYTRDWAPPTPDDAVEITTDPIKAPSDMANACGAAGYTVDDSYEPLFRNPNDRDEHRVLFHCNDGSRPATR